MSRLSTRAVCVACRRTVVITLAQMVERPAPEKSEGVSEHGIVCPACGHFTHACYDSPELRRLREQLDKAANTQTAQTIAAAYRAAFKRLQKELAA